LDSQLTALLLLVVAAVVMMQVQVFPVAVAAAAVDTAQTRNL
jgi:hypothetical protein